MTGLSRDTVKAKHSRFLLHYEKRQLISLVQVDFDHQTFNGTMRISLNVVGRTSCVLVHGNNLQVMNATFSVGSTERRTLLCIAGLISMPISLVQALSLQRLRSTTNNGSGSSSTSDNCCLPRAH